MGCNSVYFCRVRFRGRANLPNKWSPVEHGLTQNLKSVYEVFAKLNSSLCTLHHFADGQKLKKNSLKFAFYRSYICTISSKLIDLTRSNITLIYSNLLLISGTCFIVAICFVFAIKVIIARKTRKRQQKTHFSKTDQTQLVFIVQIS